MPGVALTLVLLASGAAALLHESAWFRLPAALVLGLLGWLLYRWRVQRLLEVERLRTRIAADLHDELGSELAAIGMSTAIGRGWVSNSRGNPSTPTSTRMTAPIRR